MPFMFFMVKLLFRTVEDTAHTEKGVKRKILSTLLLLCLAAASLHAEEEENSHIAPANRTLAATGLPPLPDKAKDMQCYSWSGLSAGIYAAFKLEEPGLASYLASFPKGVEKADPIPASLLAPPNASAPWFAPAGIQKGFVLFRGRIFGAAPETFRLYVDEENSQLFLFYTWNNKRTYP